MTKFYFHFIFEFQIELEFELRYETNDDQALLIMMTWHYQQVITVANTWGCYNSPPLTRILVPRIKRKTERERGILHEDDLRVPKWLHLQNDSTTEL